MWRDSDFCPAEAICEVSAKADGLADHGGRAGTGDGRSSRRIKAGLASELRLGNLEAKRDWGHAKDYVRAMHAMLQLPEADDFVIATGQTHSVRELCEIAFAEVDLDYREFVKVDERYYRPAEVDQLVGDASKAHAAFGWEPTYSFRDLVKEMVASDLAALTSKSGDEDFSRQGAKAQGSSNYV